MSRNTEMLSTASQKLLQALPSTLTNPSVTVESRNAGSVRAALSKHMPYYMRFSIRVDAVLGSVTIGAEIASLYSFFDKSSHSDVRTTLPMSVVDDTATFKSIVRLLVRSVMKTADFSIPPYGTVTSEEDEKKMLQYVVRHVGVSEDRLRANVGSLIRQW
jgi:hypothetical protein